MTDTSYGLSSECILMKHQAGNTALLLSGLSQGTRWRAGRARRWEMSIQQLPLAGGEHLKASEY